ncbi:MAG TPA: hypothetical protein VK890_08285, partial [Bacteroidia bacterium]|nr:hypothetical protein [Bacteroidia bacterium]
DREKSPSPEASLINGNCLMILKEIKKIFDKHKTNYKIVISPLYSQETFNSKDLNELNELFDSSNVFDFSGKNQYTENIGNYYDNSHYKTFIGSQLLKKIYRNTY